MSYNNYQSQYGSNPYGGSGDGGYGSNPYGQTSNGGGYGASNPYQSEQTQHASSGAYEQTSTQQGGYQGSYNQGPQAESGYGAPAPSAGPMSKDDFLARIDGTKRRINELSSNIAAIAAIHQRLLGSPDTNASSQLEHLVSQTQVLNTGIKDEIKFLERDSARSQGDSIKASQLKSVTASFKERLQDYQKEESDYRKRYQDAIARQYRIVNPGATEEEVREASQADWGDEGVFQTALKTNRSGQAASVLGAVRARHNDIARIEKTLTELVQLFRELNETVVVQEPMVQNIEQQTEAVHNDTQQANAQLDRGIEHARRARRLKWICLGITVLIIAIIALVLGIYFGVVKKPSNNNNP